MAWTRRQVRYLLSGGSPLTGQQQAKMKSELHANPTIGHARKGYKKKSFKVSPQLMGIRS